MEFTSFLLGVFNLCMFISFCHFQEHFENVALNKPCNMTSQRHVQPNCSGAVNGNTAGNYTPNGTNCISTNPLDNSSWWEVNLGRPYPVCNITIWNLPSDPQRMLGVKVSIDSTLYYTYDNTTPNVQMLPLVCKDNIPVTGTVIRLSKDDAALQLNTKYRSIRVCEVEVLSCSDAYWGLWCTNLCGNCGNNEVCDKVTGKCTSCLQGWELPMCDVCSDGYWGSQCKKCGNCRNGDACDKVTGHCTTCSAEWKPPLCAVCIDGYWDSECNKRCGNCSNGEACDKVTGHCPSCSPGWKPPLCDTVCEDGSWGTNCEEKCGNCNKSEVCDKVTGHCSDCSPEFILPLCLPAPEEASSSGASSGAVVGAVVGVLLVIAVVIVVVLIWRRRRNNPKQEVNGTTVEQTTHDAVYQNVNGTINGGSTQGARRTETNGNLKPEAYVNVSLDKDAAEPTVQGQPVSQPRTQPVSQPGTQPVSQPGTQPVSQPRTQSVAPPPIPPMEEGDVDVVEDNEVVVEGDQSYDVAVRGRVYYNDEVYMTSAGSSLKLDQVQEYLLGKLRSDDMDTEFKKLPLGLLKDHEAGLRKENRDKNRYNAILPYDETRVVLRGPYDKDSTDYINASFMRGHQSRKAYIATQGPRRNTMGDFWKMVWQNNVSNIVMLTNLKEDGKKKCEQYWPGKGKQYRYGLVDVLGLEEHVRADYVMRTFQIRLGKEKVRNVTQYHYTTWPDHGIPKTTALVDFWRTVHMAHRAQTHASPLLVHCSAGIGRTGTFIALDIVKNQLRANQHIDVFNVLKDMRNDRCYMIQTKSQYSILYEAVLESYTTKDCRLQLEAFDFAFKHPVDPHSKHERTEAEFRELKQMKVLMQKPSHVEAEKMENINKNRDTSTLPDDSQLVPLTFPVDGRNAFINAVCLPSFSEQRSSILTQFPLPDTVVDLWRLVAGSDVCRIVSLGSDQSESETKNCYWPRKEGERLTFGPFTVCLMSAMSLGQHTKRYCLTLQCQGQKPREVELLHYSDWSGETPGSVHDFVQLVDIVSSSRQQQGKTGGPVLLQCSNGTTKSALFHAICDVIGRMMSDRVIDVYMAVRKMHIVRPECVATEVQYRYIYLAVQEYKKKSEIYNNI